MGKPGKRKFRSQRRKKRKGFCGPVGANKRQKLDESDKDDVHAATSSTTTDQDGSKELQARPNMSAQKLQNSSFSTHEEKKGVFTRETSDRLGLGSCKRQRVPAHGYKLQDANLLSDCISSAAICSSCRNPKSKLQLYQCDSQREGLAESLLLICSLCDKKTPLKTSKRLGGFGGGAHEVNRRSVVASHKLGLAGLTDFCSRMNLSPPVTKKAYNDHLIQIEKAAVENATVQMQNAADRLFKRVERESPESVEEEEGTRVAKVAVSVDGTWQKRGHSSKIGVVFVISIRTGEILDYEVKSLACHECKAKEHLDKDTEEYRRWRDVHEGRCQINHTGSSEEMEATAAVKIFSRSVKTRQLKYITFVGDGDSSSFGRVRDAMQKEFGDRYVIQKEECVGHVQKRLGTALRKYKKDRRGQKLADGKGVGGKGRLTDKVIDRMQNYYGKAIRNNSGDLEGMKESIKAVECHMIVDETLPLEKQHQHCPKGEDTWCKFWIDKLQGTDTYDDNKRLPEVFLKELQPIFKRLSNDDLLSRCLKGITQNQNESANGQLWSRCPKTKFCGVRKVRIAVCETVAVFNTGAANKAEVLGMCGVAAGQNMMKALRKEDQNRIRNAEKKISEKYRRQRQKLRSKKKSKGELSYSSGAFGLSAKPETVKGQKKKLGKVPKAVPKVVQGLGFRDQVQVTFVKPLMEVVATTK